MKLNYLKVSSYHPFAFGSCSHLHQHSTEVCGIQCDGVYQGEECDIDCEKPQGTEEELHRRELLGDGVLCVHGGVG
jgi:hypothetical protein